MDQQRELQVAVTKSRIFENNLSQLMQSYKKTTITMDELKRIDTNAKLYRAAGRMFMQWSHQEFTEDLAKSLKAFEEDIKMEKELKIQNDKKIEELSKAVQDLMKKGK